MTIPGPNLPTLFVCHQLGFCITIPEVGWWNQNVVKGLAPPALLQVLAIPLCQHHGGEGQSGRPVLCLLQSKNLVKFVKVLFVSGLTHVFHVRIPLL